MKIVAEFIRMPAFVNGEENNCADKGLLLSPLDWQVGYEVEWEVAISAATTGVRTVKDTHQPSCYN